MMFNKIIPIVALLSGSTALAGIYPQLEKYSDQTKQKRSKVEKRSGEIRIASKEILFLLKTTEAPIVSASVKRVAREIADSKAGGDFSSSLDSAFSRPVDQEDFLDDSAAVQRLRQLYFEDSKSGSLLQKYKKKNKEYQRLVGDDEKKATPPRRKSEFNAYEFYQYLAGLPDYERLHQLNAYLKNIPPITHPESYLILSAFSKQDQWAAQIRLKEITFTEINDFSSDFFSEWINTVSIDCFNWDLRDISLPPMLTTTQFLELLETALSTDNGSKRSAKRKEKTQLALRNVLRAHTGRLWKARELAETKVDYRMGFILRLLEGTIVDSDDESREIQSRIGQVLSSAPPSLQLGSVVRSILKGYDCSQEGDYSCRSGDDDHYSDDEYYDEEDDSASRSDSDSDQDDATPARKAKKKASKESEKAEELIDLTGFDQIQQPASPGMSDPSTTLGEFDPFGDAVQQGSPSAVQMGVGAIPNPFGDPNSALVSQSPVQMGIQPPPAFAPLPNPFLAPGYPGGQGFQGGAAPQMGQAPSRRSGGTVTGGVPNPHAMMQVMPMSSPALQQQGEESRLANQVQSNLEAFDQQHYVRVRDPQEKGRLPNPFQ